MLRRVTMVFGGVLLVMGACLIQAPYRQDQDGFATLSVVKTSPTPGETFAERVSRVRHETMNQSRKNVRELRISPRKRDASNVPVQKQAKQTDSLTEPFSARDQSGDLLSDNTHKNDEKRFDPGAVAAVNHFHANQKDDAQLTTDYLKRHSDLEGQEELERSDLIANFNKDAAVLPMTQNDIEDINDLLQGVTPVEDDKFEKMSPEERRKLLDFIEKQLLAEYQNAPYGHKDELPHQEISPEERRKLLAFIEQKLFPKSSNLADMSEYDREDDSPVFREVSDMVHQSNDTITNNLDDIHKQNAELISSITSKTKNFEAVLGSSTSSDDAKKDVEAQAKELAVTVDNNIEKTSDVISDVKESSISERKAKNWYANFITQQSMLEALSFGLKATALGIVGYGMYKGISPHDVMAAPNTSSVATIASAPISSVVHGISRGSLEGLTFNAPTHGKSFQEHKTIPTDYRKMITSIVGGR